MNREETVAMEIGRKTVGEVVAEDFRVAKVFDKYGIDFCCGGKMTIAEACREKEVQIGSLLQEMEQVQGEALQRNENYAGWALPFLADYIVNTHHVYLREDTPQIAAYAKKIAAVHGALHPETVEIARIFDQVAADMTAHLREEEEVLFPAVKRIEAARAAGQTAPAEDVELIRASLAKLDEEHQAIGDAVHTIRHLANGYQIPADVCNTYVVTYRKLKEFEDDLHKHVHLENNILFPKAARL